MADTTVFLGYDGSNTPKFRVWDGTGQLWNGSAFEAYSAGNLANYNQTLTQQGNTPVYTGTFPADIDAGEYQIGFFEQLGGSPAESDPCLGLVDKGWNGSAFIGLSDIETYGDTNWATITGATLRTELLTTNNKIKVDGNNEVTAENMVGTDGANTTTPPTPAAVATATRTEMDSNSTQLAAIKAHTNELQTDLTNGGRLDLLIDDIILGTTRIKDGGAMDTVTDAIKVVTDKLDDTLEDDGGTFRFTANALEEVLDQAIDGTLTLAQAVTRIAAIAGGKIVRTATSPLALEFYADDDATLVLTMTVQNDGSGRTKA